MSDAEGVLLADRAVDQAQALIELGRYEQALPLLSQALAQAPDDDWLHCRMADAYYFLDQHDNALKHARNALGLNPNNVYALYRLSWLQLAFHDFDGALKSATAAANIEPDDGGILYTLAWTQYHNGQLSQALVTAAQALELDPEDADLHRLLADLTLNAGKYAQAESHYREALRHNPEDALIHSNLAKSLQAQNKIAEAAEHYLAAVKIDAADEDYRNELFELVHHEIMDQPLQNRDKALSRLDPAVRYFYEDQLNRRGFMGKLRITSIVSLWLLALGVLMAFFTWVTGDNPVKMIRFVLVVAFIYMLLFLAKVALQFVRQRKSKAVTTNSSPD
ncbi:MAG: tetratricopeptide repeat protein [Gammaproteobacteria bacterium]|nr:tetratricopeptide repeat protein [Gammaproteobacteria bacterium]MDH5802779.1 tetratricopeptide repeat protein [Gammaproteobacteria bacterium]